MIEYVKLKNYKSLVDLKVSFMQTKDKPKKMILIYGENGIGKSNFASAFLTLNETMNTMSSVSKLQQFLEHIGNEELIENEYKLNFIEKIKDNFKSTEMIIKNYKTINSNDNMLLEFGFKYKGKEGIYKIEFGDKEIVSESLHYVLSKNQTCFFDINKNNISYNDNLFKDKNYSNEFKKILDKYWGKHSFFSILSYEIEDKKKGYVESKIDKSLYNVWLYLKTICIKVKGKNHSEIEFFGSNHIKLLEFEHGKISSKYEDELNKIEKIINIFFTSISSDIKNVYYAKEYLDDTIKYNLIVRKNLYGKLVDIDFQNESTGIMNLLDLIPYFLAVCEGKTVVIDELDTGIHDLLVAKILNNLKDYIKGQLIITTHNTMLIESDIRKDNIYVFNVNRDAYKELIPITDFNGRIHKNINPRKKYLSNAYGGVPIVSTIDFDELLDI